jgi:hypothetical protein
MLFISLHSDDGSGDAFVEYWWAHHTEAIGDGVDACLTILGRCSRMQRALQCAQCFRHPLLAKQDCTIDASEVAVP